MPRAKLTGRRLERDKRNRKIKKITDKQRKTK